MNQLTSKIVDCIGRPFAGSIANEICIEHKAVIESEDQLSQRWAEIKGLGLEFVLDTNKSVGSGREIVAAVHFTQPDLGSKVSLPLGLQFGMTVREAADVTGWQVKARRIKGPLGKYWFFREIDSRYRWTLSFRNKSSDLFMVTVETKLFDRIYYE